MEWKNGHEIEFSFAPSQGCGYASNYIKHISQEADNGNAVATKFLELQALKGDEAPSKVKLSNYKLKYDYDGPGSSTPWEMHNHNICNFSCFM